MWSCTWHASAAIDCPDNLRALVFARAAVHYDPLSTVNIACTVGTACAFGSVDTRGGGGGKECNRALVRGGRDGRRRRCPRLAIVLVGGDSDSDGDAHVNVIVVIRITANQRP